MSNGIDIVAMMATAAVTPVSDRADRGAILDVAREPVAAALGKPVIFKVQTLQRSGDWVFLLAEMEDRDGQPVDYAGTPHADDAKHGTVSKLYAALLRHEGETWQIVDRAIGPTDLAWEGWAKRHGAPAALFKL